MKFYVIASSSKGNASYLETKSHKILIDAGISFLKIKLGLKKIGVEIEQITDLLITHEHSDHVKGLDMLLKHIKPNIYLSEGTKKALKLNFPVNILKAFEQVELNDLKIMPLPLSHDANEPLGFLFSNGENKIAYLTDTGYINQQVLNLIENSTLYFLESNHDAFMLTNSNRPFHLIRRILNEKGHLSNYDAAYYFAKAFGDKTKYLIFAHISQECNTLDLIKSTFNEILLSQEKAFNHISFKAAKPDEPIKAIVL